MNSKVCSLNLRIRIWILFKGIGLKKQFFNESIVSACYPLASNAHWKEATRHSIRTSQAWKHFPSSIMHGVNNFKFPEGISWEHLKYLCCFLYTPHVSWRRSVCPYSSCLDQAWWQQVKNIYNSTLRQDNGAWCDMLVGVLFWWSCI
jgi:hypothetical protein